jgi:hypothetical protein
MSDEANPQVAVLPPPPGPEPARPEVAEAPEVKENAGTNGTISAKTTEPKEGATDAPVESMIAFLLLNFRSLLSFTY